MLTRRGKPAVVVLSAKEYGELTAGKPNFIEHLLSGPEWDDEMHEEVNRRSKGPSRPPIEF
ncbi:prevent-host-death protein [Mesorhizobium sp. CAU 1732]|uniref:prevent-host-death protein n=1 Tax=Mesorhizobium sp. CAU 1732 TaxID=3140358 RepID=UPI0032619E9E